MGNPVVHFEIVGKDAPRVRTFFAEVFGWRPGPFIAGPGLPDYTVVETGAEAGINGGIGSCPDGYDGHVTFYVHVPSVAEAFATIEQHGGSRMMGPDAVPGGPVIGLFRDPAGNVIGLVEGEAAAAGA